MTSSFLRSSYLIFASPSIFFWAKLFCGRVPPNNTLFGRTVLPNNAIFSGTPDSENHDVYAWKGMNFVTEIIFGNLKENFLTIWDVSNLFLPINFADRQALSN